jgi:uncharacterized damage-inducible protein DinB
MLLVELMTLKRFFDRSTACLMEDDSTYAPVEGLMTVSQMVFHVARTVDWFFEGAFRPEGFDMDFSGYEAEVEAVTSLSAARQRLDKAFDNAARTIREHGADEWDEPLPEGPVMGGAPRRAILGGLNDHTAHHRGALAVYARLRGHVPAMPYM